MRAIALIGGAVAAVALTASGAGAAIAPPTAGLPAGINLVVCSDGGPTTYVVDGPVFRSGALASGQCKGIAVQPGTYAVSAQDVTLDAPGHYVSVTRPGGPRASYQRTSVITGVDAVPTTPTFGPTDANGYPTGVNTPSSGPGINVTAIVFQHSAPTRSADSYGGTTYAVETSGASSSTGSSGGSSTGSSGGSSGGSAPPCVVDHVNGPHSCP